MNTSECTAMSKLTSGIDNKIKEKCTHMWANRKVHVPAEVCHRTATPVFKDVQVGPTNDLQQEQNE